MRLGLARLEEAGGAQMAEPAMSTARAAPEPFLLLHSAGWAFYHVKHNDLISWILLFYFSPESCDNSERALQMRAI